MVCEESCCSVCDKKFSRAFTAKRHMIEQHGVSKDDPLVKEIKTSSKACKHCKQCFFNVWKHMAICKVGIKTQARLDKARERIVDHPTQHPEAEGQVFWERFLHWYASEPSHGDGTKGNYQRKARQIVDHWLVTIDGLTEDSLLAPLENELCWPSLNSYLVIASGDADRCTAIKSYRVLGNFMKDWVQRRYAANSDYTLLVKETFKQSIDTNYSSVRDKVSGLNRHLKISTAMRVAEQTKDPAFLKFNPDRMKTILSEVYHSKVCIGVLEKLNRLSVENLRKNLDEVTARNAIISSLVFFGAGHRGSAVTSMRVSEFVGAPLISSVRVASVRYHKTFARFGPANIPFILPGLYSACQKYHTAYKPDALQEDLLFANRNGKEPSGKLSMDWILDQQGLSTVQEEPSEVVDEAVPEEEERLAESSDLEEENPEKSSLRYTFSSEDRELLKTALITPDGTVSKSFAQSVIDDACRKSHPFRKLYQKLVEMKGSKRKANQTIGSSVKSRVPKKPNSSYSFYKYMQVHKEERRKKKS